MGIPACCMAGLHHSSQRSPPSLNKSSHRGALRCRVRRMQPLCYHGQHGMGLPKGSKHSTGTGMEATGSVPWRLGTVRPKDNLPVAQAPSGPFSRLLPSLAQLGHLAMHQRAPTGHSRNPDTNSICSDSCVPCCLGHWKLLEGEAQCKGLQRAAPGATSGRQAQH